MLYDTDDAPKIGAEDVAVIGRRKKDVIGPCSFCFPSVRIEEMETSAERTTRRNRIVDDEEDNVNNNNRELENKREMGGGPLSSFLVRRARLLFEQKADRFIRRRTFYLFSRALLSRRGAKNTNAPS